MSNSARTRKTMKSKRGGHSARQERREEGTRQMIDFAERGEGTKRPTAKQPRSQKGRRPSEPAIGSPEWDLLEDEVIFLKDAIDPANLKDVAQRCPEALDAHAKLLFACRRFSTMETLKPPSSHVLIDALEKFYSLPAPERIRLLNGWRLDRWPAVDNVYEHKSATQMVVITTGADGGINVDDELCRQDSTAPVVVHVRAGSSRAEVLEAIDKIRRVVAEQWDAVTLDINEVRTPPATPAPAKSTCGPSHGDPAHLTLGELFDLAVENEVLKMRLAKYGCPEESYVQALRTPDEVRDAVSNEFSFMIDAEAEMRFEEWEQARGTFGKTPRLGDDETADAESEAEQQKAA